MSDMVQPQLRYPGLKKATANIAKLFDDAGIGYVLVGYGGIAIVASDLGYDDIDVLVEDDQLDTAIETILAAEYDMCVLDDCYELQEDRMPELDAQINADSTEEEIEAHYRKITRYYDRYHLVANAHFHVSGDDEDEYVLSLYPKSEMFKSLPDLPIGTDLASDDPCFILSTDEARLPARGLKKWIGDVQDVGEVGPNRGRSSGPWYELYPVKTLTPATHVNVVIERLWQDFDLVRKIDWMWYCQLHHLGEREIKKPEREPEHEPEGELEAKAEDENEPPAEPSVVKYQLDERFQEFWDSFRGHIDVDMETDIFASLYRLCRQDENTPTGTNARPVFELKRSWEDSIDAAIQGRGRVDGGFYAWAPCKLILSPYGTLE